jgi:hypothetical protein
MVTNKQSEDWFLYIICAVLFAAFVLYLIGGAR